MQKTVFWIGVAVAAVVALGLSYSLIQQPDGGAAWVQAIGSVVAIIVAIGINWEQHQQAINRKLKEERAIARKLITILQSLNDNLRVTAREAADRLEDRNQGETTQNRVQALRSTEQLQYATSELPLTSMPDEEVAQLLLEVRWNVDTAHAIANQRAHITENVGGAEGKGGHWRTIEESANQAHRLLADAFLKYKD